MELELGLSLSNNNPVVLHGLDLNNHFYQSKEIDTWSYGCCLENKNNYKKKRSFHEAFEKSTRAAAAPDDDRNKDLEKRSPYSYTITKDDGEENSVVGWPPIQSWRKKQLYYQNQDGHVLDNNQGGEKGFGGSDFMYVKVKMEGVAIGRKVDLSLHHSYQTLTNALICMFQKYQKGIHGLKDATSYALTYQDREGDWLLAGDVPWQIFIESVQCLKIIKTGC